MSNRDRQFNFFISSTYLDNAERRKLVEDAVLRAGMLQALRVLERLSAPMRPFPGLARRGRPNSLASEGAVRGW